MKLSEMPPEHGAETSSNTIPDNSAIRDTTSPEFNLDEIVKRFNLRENEVDKELESRREETRNHVTRTILNGFVILVLLFALFICCISAFGDISRIPILLDSAKTLISIVTPIVTFILGFYYATKAAS